MTQTKSAIYKRHHPVVFNSYRRSAISGSRSQCWHAMHVITLYVQPICLSTLTARQPQTYKCQRLKMRMKKKKQLETRLDGKKIGPSKRKRRNIFCFGNNPWNMWRRSVSIWITTSKFGFFYFAKSWPNQTHSHSKKLLHTHTRHCHHPVVKSIKRLWRSKRAKLFFVCVRKKSAERIECWCILQLQYTHIESALLRL